jgi:hypothetical protein
VVRIPLTIFGYSLRCVINNYPRIPTTGQTLVTSWRGHLGRLERSAVKVACSVLREERRGNPPDPPDCTR